MVPAGKLKRSQAWFKYRENRMLLHWQGPAGGNDLIGKHARLPPKILFVFFTSSQTVTLENVSLTILHLDPTHYAETIRASFSISEEKLIYLSDSRCSPLSCFSKQVHPGPNDVCLSGSRSTNTLV
jgi:hypothetical protein